jgi:predicted nucleic acid-binding protein
LIVLDTTVFVYAVGVEHPLKESSKRVLEAVQSGAVQGATTAGVLQEFADVRARRRPRSDAVALARDFAALLSPLQRVEESDVDLGLRIFERSDQLGSFDAVLAAVAINRDAEALISSDRGFRGVRRLRHVDIGGPELDELLGG